MNLTYKVLLAQRKLNDETNWSEGFFSVIVGTKKPAVIYELMMEQINIFNESNWF